MSGRSSCWLLECICIGLGKNLILMCALLFLLIAPAAAGYAYDPSLPLHPVEHEALLQFKASIFNDDKLLKTWIDDNNTSPCNDWEGVDCNCAKLYPAPVEPHPCPDNDDGLFDGGDGYNHVYRLDFGPRKPSNKRLHGVYSPYLGNLTEVRQFYLHVNKFEGTMPTEFGKLQKLQRLLVRDNILTGNIPAELGSALGLKDLYFDNNALSGCLPASLCNIVMTPDSVLNVVQPSNNPYLCGEVPDCLYGKYLNPLHVVGTHLIYPPADDPSSTRVAGYCSKAPPKCDRENDCYVDAPAVVPSLQEFDFRFTNFTDNIGMRSYSWCIGTKPGVCDAQSITPYTTVRREESQQARGLQQPALNRVTYTARGVSLMNGGKYYVSVIGENMAGPPLQSNVTSSVILADNTPPLPNKIKPTLDCSKQSSGDQYDTTRVSLCWEEFSEPESSIRSYQAGLEDREGKTIVELFDVGNATSVTMDGLDLVPGQDYVGIVRAVNTAGLHGSGRSLSLRILATPTDNSGSNLAWIIIIAVLVPAMLIIGAVFYRARQRLLKRIRIEKWHAANALQLEELRSARDVRRGSLSGSISGSISLGRLDEDEIIEQEEAILFGDVSTSLFFVFTDVEGSTAISQSNPSAHKIIQEVHDGTIRQCIGDNNGYEINTQGDAFEVAFLSAYSAATFCLEVQKRLLEMKWPKEVLKIQACRQETNIEGLVIFAGPRVRMGIHKAQKDGITRRIHDLTKHVVFGGPEFLLARAVGDCAHGGQIVCSKEAAFDILRNVNIPNYHPNMKFLGDYYIRETEHIPIYQLMPVWGSSVPRRAFPLELLDAERLESSEQPTFRIMSRPTIAQDSRITSCILRISEYAILKQSLTAVNLADEIIASLAQNYGGYIETLSSLDDNLRLVSFKDTALALQFSMMIHASFLYAPWEHHISGFTNISAFDSKFGPSGTLIWRGPRVAMVIDGVDFSGVKNEALDENNVPGLVLPIELVKYVNVGQSVLTDEAWQSLQKRPMRCSFISLGKMMFLGIKRPVMLIQAMPKILQTRSFDIIACERYISPGYFQAPKPSEGVAVVFCAPSGLGEDDSNGLSAEDRTTILQKWCSLFRCELDRFHGYECKEVDGGKFLCAFGTYPHAIAFASSVQATLRKSPGEWISPSMERALGSPYLPVAIGAAFGLQLFRKPQRASGRADYFGVIPNLAARVTSQAKPGQSLICVVSEEGVMDFAAKHQDGQGVKFHYSDHEIIYMKNVGAVKLKGFDFTPMLAQCNLDNGAEHEDFGRPKGWIGDHVKSLKPFKPKRRSSELSCVSTASGISVGRRSSARSSGMSVSTVESLSRSEDITQKTDGCYFITSRRNSERRSSENISSIDLEDSMDI